MHLGLGDVIDPGNPGDAPCDVAIPDHCPLQQPLKALPPPGDDPIRNLATPARNCAESLQANIKSGLLIHTRTWT